MFSNDVPLSSNEVFGQNKEPTLGYMLFVHRNKLRSTSRRFVRALKLAQTKLYITKTLISETKKHIHQQLSFEDLSILNREQLFCNRLKKKVNCMLTWKKMSPEQRLEIKRKANAIRELQDNVEGNCAKSQKLDDKSELIKGKKVQLIEQDDQ